MSPGALGTQAAARPPNSHVSHHPETAVQGAADLSVAAASETALMPQASFGQSLTATNGPAAPTALASFPDVAMQIRQAIPAAIPTGLAEAVTAAGRGTTIELQLSPVELGRVQLDLAASGETLRITIMAERPETLDLMRRHADQLLADLRQSGFGDVQAQFGQWPDQKSGQQEPARNANAPPAEATPSDPHIRARQAMAQNRSADGGLDLRL